MKTILVISIAFAGIGCLAIGANTNNVAAGQAVETPMETPVSGDFHKNLPKDFESPTDDAGRLLLREYGAVFVTRGGATPPKKVVFVDESDVVKFQSTLDTSKATIGAHEIELQTPAMNALKKAVAEAKAAGLTIAPNAKTAARRKYEDTVEFWNDRLTRGFARWVPTKVSTAERDRILKLSPYKQVPEILKLEESKIYFAKHQEKSVIYSVAPPGTSQHISMLAVDIGKHMIPRVREILAKYGWFQTVYTDLPHFTYLGVAESELNLLGLKQKLKRADGETVDRVYWLPAI